jgi:hypothetical protein
MRYIPFWTALLLAACTATGAPDADDRAASGDPADTPRAHAPAAPDTGAGADGSVVVDGVRYSAATAVLESFPVQLHTTVDIENTGAAAAHLQFPSGCVVLLRAYRAAADPSPAWDQGRTVMCTMAIQLLELEPGASRQYGTRTDAREILGDSLPAGAYHLRAYVAVNGGVVEVPAGSVELAVPRE